jgi:hypothetical protein
MSATKQHGSHRRRECSVGTIPLTIAKAIEVCNVYQHQKDEQQKKQHHENIEKGELSILTAAAPIVDLLVIVTHVETNHHPHQKRSFVRIWVQDTSSSVDEISIKNAAVQILCFGQRRRKELIDELQLRSGDIMRFNRIVTMPCNARNMNTLTFTCDIHNPEVGVEYYRFGNISDADFLAVIKNKLLNIEDIPISMQTNLQCLERLVEWSLRQHSPTTETTMSMFKNECRYIGNMSVLNSLPCQHRSVLEFQSCIGLIGHVTVVVVQLERYTIAPHRAKLRHSNNIPATAHLFVTLMDYALVSSSVGMTQPVAFVIDSTCDVDRSLYDKFLKILLRAYSSNRPVVLTNVKAMRNHSQNPYIRYAPYSLLSESTDGIIVPTSKSDIKLIENPVPAEYIRDWELSQRSLLQPTVNESMRTTLETLRMQSSILKISILSPGDSDLSFSETNLDDDSCIESLLSLIFPCHMHNACKSEIKSYGSVASIHISINDSTNQAIVAEASKDILLRLCGVDVCDATSEIKQGQSKRMRQSANSSACVRKNVEQNDKKEKLHRNLVKLLFYSLLSEKVELQWEIQKINDTDQVGEIMYRVLNVWLAVF